MCKAAKRSANPFSSPPVPRSWITEREAAIAQVQARAAFNPSNIIDPELEKAKHRAELTSTSLIVSNPFDGKSGPFSPDAKGPFSPNAKGPFSKPNKRLRV